MTIEVRNFTPHPYLNGDSKAFSADLYINDNHTAILFDRGIGDFRSELKFHADYDLYDQAVTLCASLPPYTNKLLGLYDEPMAPFYVAFDMITRRFGDLLIDDNFNKDLQEKTATHIAWGKLVDVSVPEDIAMAMYDTPVESIELDKPVAELLNTAAGVAQLTKALDECRQRIIPGEFLFNNNLPVELTKGLVIHDIVSLRGIGAMSYEFAD